MVYALKEFAELDLSKLFPKGTCPHCKKVIFNEMDHEDCYWDSLGDLFEQHPPGIPGLRR